MKLSASFSGFSEALKTAEIVAAMGAMKAMSRAQEQMKQEVRDQTTAAGLEKLAKSWQGTVYPVKGRSLTPAAYVFSKAPKIIEAYAKGATIVAKAGRRFLAIPTDDVPKKRQGAALTPREVEQRYGKRLRFVPRASAQGSQIAGRAIGYLMIDGVVARKSTGRLRNASAREQAGGSRNKVREVQSVVMFVLVASVKVPKKLDLEGVLNRAAASLPQLLAEEWGQ